MCIWCMCACLCTCVCIYMYHSMCGSQKMTCQESTLPPTFFKAESLLFVSLCAPA